ncbi:hypothetical protein ACFFOU_15685 [Pseudonocardia sulfidoxydans]|uniref:hypothetical protein n=1 Tax=Pseudonocardia sulfidoxydans TaxID=54011 RepID=UPI0011BFCAFB|nr:hypothetical protein [Pseudonocardia sulfidoxydans]
MPIRSPRGRAAAYRSLWQWPLHSPLRLVGTVVVVLVLAAGVSWAATSGRSSAPSAPGQNTSGPSTSDGRPATAGSPSVLPPVVPLNPTTLPLTAAPQAALAAASSWASAWVDHPAGTTTEQWLARLRPWTTDEYLGVLGSVDPGNVPASTVTGPPEATRVSPASVQVKVPTDTITLILLVVDDGSGWRVADSDEG